MLRQGLECTPGTGGRLGRDRVLARRGLPGQELRSVGSLAARHLACDGALLDALVALDGLLRLLVDDAEQPVAKRLRSVRSEVLTPLEGDDAGLLQHIRERDPPQDAFRHPAARSRTQDAGTAPEERAKCVLVAASESLHELQVISHGYGPPLLGLLGDSAPLGKSNLTAIFMAKVASPFGASPPTTP